VRLHHVTTKQTQNVYVQEKVFAINVAEDKKLIGTVRSIDTMKQKLVILIRCM
jgi:hypothetical protein